MREKERPFRGCKTAQIKRYIDIFDGKKII